MPYKFLISKAHILAYKQISANVDFDTKIKPWVREAQDFDFKALAGPVFFSDLMAKYGVENFTINYDNIAGGVFAANDSLTTPTNAATGTAISVDGANKKIVVKGVNADQHLLWSTAASVTNGAATADIISITFGKYYKLVNGETYNDPQTYSIAFEGLKAAIAYWTFARYRQNAQEESTATGFVNKTNQYSTPTSSKTIAERVTQARSGALSYWKDVEKYICDMNILFPNTYDLWTKTRNSQGKQSGGLRITSINRFDDENSINYNNKWNSR